MSIELYQLDDGVLEVNGKVVSRDMNGNWVSAVELLPSEQAAVNGWIRQNL
jgi:hypothetical protein